LAKDTQPPLSPGSQPTTPQYDTLLALRVNMAQAEW